MDKIEPQVTAVAQSGGAVVVLRINGYQLQARQPGDLVTAEILAVIPEHEGDG